MRRGTTGKGGRPGRGANLAEIALYLAVAMAIIVGALSTYREANIATTVAAQTQVLAALVAEGRAVLAAHPDAGGRLDEVLRTSGAVPATVVVPVAFAFGSRLRTEWDTELALTVIDVGAGPRMRLRLHDIPVAACTRLSGVEADGTGIFGNGITALGISGAVEVPDPGPPPWTIAQVASLCSTAGAGAAEGRVTVTFLLDPL